MANELYLSYDALGTAATQFTTSGDDLEAHLPIRPCDTGIVDISAALTTIGQNTQKLATNLATLGTITTEVRNEVVTVDEDQQLRYPNPFSTGPLYPLPTVPGTTPASPLPADPGAPPVLIPPLGTVPPSYVNPDGAGDHLDLPPELTPMGPYAPGKDPS